jgi:phage shock protein PspC (stress-responsive transcriptional regulator)
MKIRTNAGIAEGMPLSDAQRYDKAVKIIKLAIAVFGSLGLWFLAILIWIIWKVLSSGAVNNYIASCV